MLSIRETMDMSPRRDDLSDDPRKLRELLSRSQQLANEHGVPSVVIGVAGREGDLLFPELVAFVESALRMEDAIFRMTRERVVLFLADVTAQQAEAILERIFSDFAKDFPTSAFPEMNLGYYEVGSRAEGAARVKDVLPSIFSPGVSARLH